MNKLKDKLIRMLGGFTEEDMRIRVRPVPAIVSRFSIHTLKVCNAIRTDVVGNYEEYMDYVKKDMAYQIADKLLEEKLIEFSSKEEHPNLIRITAILKSVMPTEVST